MTTKLELEGAVRLPSSRLLGTGLARKASRLILALAAFVAASAALGQQFPTVPDRTVVGRIGAGGGSGPSQAIPMASLLTTLQGVQPANKVWAGPTSGGAAAPSFRALVGADIPNVLGNTYFSGTRPWCDVRGQGAVGDGFTDDTAAFNACKTLLGNGGTIFVPLGNYCVFSGLNFDTGGSSNGDIILVGAGVRYSAISTCGHNVIAIRMNNQFSRASNLAIYGYGMSTGDQVGGQTVPAFAFGSGCSYCALEHSYVAGGTQAIQNQANYSYFNQVTAQYSYGGVTNGTANFYTINSGPLVIASSFDQVWPYAQPAHGSSAPASRNNTTLYSAGALVNVTCNGKTYVWQATVGGTSGGSQPGCKIYGQNITDGTVTWQLAKPGTFYAVQADTATNELKLSNVDMTGAFDAGLAITNSFGGAAPQAITVTDTTIGGTLSQGVLASTGTNLDIHNLEVSLCILPNCKAIHFDTGWLGTARVMGGRVINNVSYGVYNGGGTGLSVIGLSVQTADVSAIYTAAAVSKFTYTGNTLGYGSNANAITVAVGASDNYNISGNNVRGASTTIVDGGSGTNKNVSGNETGVGLGVGSSPITGGTSGRVLYDNAGTLGEYAISGTGSVCMTTSCAMTTPGLGAATGQSLALSGSGGLTAANSTNADFLALDLNNTNAGATATVTAKMARTDAGTFSVNAASSAGGGYSIFNWSGPGGMFMQGGSGGLTLRDGSSPANFMVSDGAQNAKFNNPLNTGGYARVASDFSVTSSTTLVNVTGLSVNVAASGVYAFDAYLTCTDAAAGGVKAAIAGTATATNIIYDGYLLDNNTVKAMTNATALATTVASSTTTNTSGLIIKISGTITVNAAGTLTVQFAQNTSSGTASVVKQGSWFKVWKIT